MKTIRGPFALPCLLLAACQVTTFEKAPIAALPGCDPALVGTWSSIDPDGTAEDDGEVMLDIGADCALTYREREADGGIRTVPATPLRVGRHGSHAYGWVDGTWGLRAAEEEDHTLPAGDVIVLRYRLDGDTLSVWSTDDKAIAHAIVDDDLNGHTDAGGGDIVNRLTGEQDPAVLDRAGFFDDEPGTFRRAAGD